MLAFVCANVSSCLQEASRAHVGALSVYLLFVKVSQNTFLYIYFLYKVRRPHSLEVKVLHFIYAFSQASR